VSNERETTVVTRDGTWSVNPATGSVSFAPKAGFVGKAEIEFVVTTRNGVTYRALLSVYVGNLRPTIPVTGADSNVVVVWGMWLVVAGVLVTAMSRRRRMWK